MAVSERARKTKSLSARLRPSELKLIQGGAHLRNIKVSEYLVSAALAHAEIDLAERAEFELPEDKASAFLEALDRPPRAKPELVDLFSTKTVLD